jgi:hypothetical protein
MTFEQTSFRDRLLAADGAPSERQALIEQEIKAMFVRKLSAPYRALMVVLSVFSLVMAGVCGYLAVTEAKLPLLARVGLGVGVLFGLAWFVMLVSVLRQGAMDMRTHGRWMAVMVWVFTVLMAVFFQVLGMTVPDRMLGLAMMANGLVFLIGAAVYWLSFLIGQSQLNTREKLLQLELRLAEMAARSGAALDSATGPNPRIG